MNKAKLYKLINKLIAFAIGFVALWFIVKQLFSKVEEISLDFILDGDWIFALPLLLALTFLNWFLELNKWNSIIKRFQILTSLQKSKSILLGITFSLITPNRIGEIGARISFIEKKNKISALVAGVFCSLNQLVVTIVVGCIALYFSDIALLSGYIPKWVLIVIPPLVLVLLLNDFLFDKFLSKKMLQSVKREYFKFEVKSKTLLMSLFRYVIFLLQFYLIVRTLNLEVSFVLSIQLIAIIFAITAVVPTAWISDLPVRMTIAYWVFEQFSISGELGIVSTAIMWFVNLCLPALIGIFYIKEINWVEIKKIKEWV